MGACNGYQYHDLRRRDWPDTNLVFTSRRGHSRADREWKADMAMLTAIASAPDEVEEMY